MQNVLFCLVEGIPVESVYRLPMPGMKFNIWF